MRLRPVAETRFARGSVREKCLIPPTLLETAILQQPWLAPVFCLGQSKRIHVNYLFMRQIFSIAVVALSVAAIASGQQQGASRDPKPVVEQVIRRLDNERIQAQIHADAAALERIYADDFIGVGPSGTVRTKPQVISDFTSGDLKFQSITTDDLRVRVYGDSAVETGRSTMDGQDKGKTVPHDTRFTRVWVKQQGRWRLVANHYSSNTSHQ
jgi:ketosteroid isomerase-like protein